MISESNDVWSNNVSIRKCRAASDDVASTAGGTTGAAGGTTGRSRVDDGDTEAMM